MIVPLPTAHDIKLICSECGYRAYPGYPWEKKHRQPHRFPCLCGKNFLTAHQRSLHLVNLGPGKLMQHAAV